MDFDKESQSDKAYRILEEMIVTLQLPPGSNWSVKRLSGLINIGIMPVREAIKKLETSHLMVTMPRLGVQVTEITLEALFLQMEVRRPIERLIVKRAARFATPQERKVFLELADNYEQATKVGDSIKVIKIDNEFNELVLHCSKNNFAEEALKPLHSLARRMYYMQYDKDTEITIAINHGHSELMRYIASGNEIEAEKSSDKLLNLAEQMFKKKFNFLEI
jgi:DNA-binding GntR family transcriptional regulator